jgi:hypothetical protein
MAGRILRGAVIILAAEKLVQHAVTALLFLGLFPAIGVPEAGDRIVLGSAALAALNAAYAVAFAVALGVFLARLPWAHTSLLALALLDIVLEFVFHQIGFITVSVIASVALLALVGADSRTSRRAR